MIVVILYGCLNFGKNKTKKSHVRRNDTNSIHTVRSLCRLTQLYPDERRACVSMFDIQWQRRASQAQKCYWTKSLKKKKKGRMKREKKSWNWQKYLVYYSVVDICCQKLHIAMVISKIKCGILSHTCGLVGVSWLDEWGSGAEHSISQILILRQLSPIPGSWL